MRDAMLSVCPIDNRSHAGTMGVIGREDRALLRSNPSARTDAGTSAGSSRHGGSRSPCLFWPESDKPRGLGAEPPRQTLARCANCQDHWGLVARFPVYPGLAVIALGYIPSPPWGASCSCKIIRRNHNPDPQAPTEWARGWYGLA